MRCNRREKRQIGQIHLQRTKNIPEITCKCAIIGITFVAFEWIQCSRHRPEGITRPSRRMMVGEKHRKRLLRLTKKQLTFNILEMPLIPRSQFEINSLRFYEDAFGDSWGYLRKQMKVYSGTIESIFMGDISLWGTIRSHPIPFITIFPGAPTLQPTYLPLCKAYDQHS